MLTAHWTHRVQFFMGEFIAQRVWSDSDTFSGQASKKMLRAQLFGDLIFKQLLCALDVVRSHLSL